MPNNIQILEAELKKQEAEKAEEARENFEAEELTEEEKEQLAKMAKVEAKTVITENNYSTPIQEYAAPLESSIEMASEGQPFKQINVGDVIPTEQDKLKEALNRANKVFRDFAIAADSDELDDNQIMEINDKALAAVSEYLKVPRLTADLVSRKLGGLSMYKLAEFLPKDFLSLYTTESELKTNSNTARGRVVAVLNYLTTVGPEVDHLNEFIDNGHRLMTVSERLMQCSVDLVQALKSPERMSAIADRAAEIDPPTDMPWEKYITGDARKVHNTFAQNAAVYEEYVKAYTTLLDEYPDTPENTDARKIIQEQIDESQAKADTYAKICELTLFREIVAATEVWLKGNTKMDYNGLEREAMSALDRIRKSKQDVPFPVYDPALSKRPKELYQKYMAEFPKMLVNYNSALMKLKVACTNPEELEDMPEYIQIEGIMEDTIHHYFALMLLIVYGRIMKRLSKNDVNKYDAITLDQYFILYCILGTDTYLMDDIWGIMKPFIEYAIKNWPKPAKKSHKK